MKKRLGLLASLAVFCLAGSALGGVINVPDDYAQIFDAVQACPSGDTVLVDPGTYSDCTHESEPPDTTKFCVYMKSGVTLRGSGPDATIIDVAGLGRGIVVEDVTNCRIENLQVTRAFADAYGAGILVRRVDSSVKLTDLKIYQNGDGGISCVDQAHCEISRVDFIDNVAKQGGGLSIEENSDTQVYDCYFYSNESPSGGAVIIKGIGTSAIMKNCVIEGNVVPYSNGAGGGITVTDARATISHCQILNNSVQGTGGGVAFLNGASGMLSHSLIKGNQADFQFSLGGGIHTDGSSPTLAFLTIVQNDAGGAFADGGGINVNFSPAPIIRNCTIAENSVGAAGLAGGICFQFGGNATVENCIIANSPSGGGITCIGATPTISCTDVWGNAGGNALCGTDGGNNFSLDPEFCGPENPVYPWAIGEDSPCTAANSPCDALVGAGPWGCGTGVPETPAGAARLLGNAPNPFNPKTSIFFVLDQAGDARMRIYDLTGRTVAFFALGELPAGQHEVVWNGRASDGRIAASGVYLYELNALGETHSRRMTLIK